MLLLTESTLFWLNLTWNALSTPVDDLLDGHVHHWAKDIPTGLRPRSNGTCPPPTSVPSLTSGVTTAVNSNTSLVAYQVCGTLSGRISPLQHLQSEKDACINPLRGRGGIRRPTSFPCQGCRSRKFQGMSLDANLLLHSVLLLGGRKHA